MSDSTFAIFVFIAALFVLALAVNQNVTGLRSDVANLAEAVEALNAAGEGR